MLEYQGSIKVYVRREKRWNAVEGAFYRKNVVAVLKRQTKLTATEECI